MTSDSSMAIEITELTKWFGDRKVVSDVTFSVARSESVGLLGPNGAGKTTILRIIAGVLAQDSGQVVIGGIDVPLGARTQFGRLVTCRRGPHCIGT